MRVTSVNQDGEERIDKEGIGKEVDTKKIFTYILVVLALSEAK